MEADYVGLMMTVFRSKCLTSMRGSAPFDGETSFTSDTTDELIETVRDLVTPAKRARERRSMPTEYIVRVA